MRTQEQILERIKIVAGDDFLGFSQEVLIAHLTFENAKQFLTPITEASKWVPEPLDREALIIQVARYMEFAWEKALSHRGISANRSVQKLTELAWLLEEDLLVADIDRTKYPQYGTPVLKLICNRMGFPMPDSQEARNMSRGEPCVPGCTSGCGT